MIWDNDDFFGGMFDFNGDGQTDAVEAALGKCRFPGVDHASVPEKVAGSLEDVDRETESLRTDCIGSSVGAAVIG